MLAPGVSVLQMALIFRSVALTDRTVCGYLLCITYADDGREQPESQSAGMHGTHHEACKACRQAASGCLPNQRSYRWQDRGWSSALDSFPACASALLSATCSQAHLCGLYTLNAAAGFMMCADKPARYIEAEFGDRGKAHGARICMRPLRLPFRPFQLQDEGVDVIPVRCKSLRSIPCCTPLNAHV